MQEGFVQAYLATWDLNWILAGIHSTFENVALCDFVCNPP